MLKNFCSKNVWLVLEGMQFIKTLTAAEQELCEKIKDYLIPSVTNLSPNTMKQYHLSNTIN